MHKRSLTQQYIRLGGGGGVRLYELYAANSTQKNIEFQTSPCIQIIYIPIAHGQNALAQFIFNKQIIVCYKNKSLACVLPPSPIMSMLDKTTNWGFVFCLQTEINMFWNAGL